MNDDNAGGSSVSRRAFMIGAAAGLAGSAIGGAGTANASEPASSKAAANAAPDSFDLDELTITQLQSAMKGGQYTSRRLCEMYFSRMDEIDRTGPMLRAVLKRNPDALTIADALDRERSAGHVRGPMHGIPVLIKDNIDTADRMSTSAGSRALANSIAPRDSFVAERLRAAGAVILGKTNLSEWANYRSTHSTSGWSGLGGQTRNPYALDRTPSGSSSGSGAATAASLCAVAVGTETDGSIVSPSAVASLVGMKPTVGLVSRAGIIPISHTQDTAGPMARTVTDAAILLSALVGADTRDAARSASKGRFDMDYTRHLDANGLRGARIGIARKHYYGRSPHSDRIFDNAVAAMRAAGATIIDPADIPNASSVSDDEGTILSYDFKHDINAYLATLGPASPMKSLADLIAYNSAHASEEMPFFGQEIFEQAQARGPLTDQKYADALKRHLRRARAEGIDAVMSAHRLDAIVSPTQGPPRTIDLVMGDSGDDNSVTSPAAIAGYPHVTVPAGFVFGLPVGVSFVGRPWSEATLLRLAYAFEQATHARNAPKFLTGAKLA